MKKVNYQRMLRKYREREALRRFEQVVSQVKGIPPDRFAQLRAEWVKKHGIGGA